MQGGPRASPERGRKAGQDQKEGVSPCANRTTGPIKTVACAAYTVSEVPQSTNSSWTRGRINWPCFASGMYRYGAECEGCVFALSGIALLIPTSKSENVRDLLLPHDFVASLVRFAIFPCLHSSFAVRYIFHSKRRQAFTTARKGTGKKSRVTLTKDYRLLPRSRAGGTAFSHSKRAFRLSNGQPLSDRLVRRIPISSPFLSCRDNVLEADTGRAVAAFAERASWSSSAGQSPIVLCSRPRRKSRLLVTSIRRNICGK